MQVIPAPNPGAAGDILYGVAAVKGTDVWAVGGQQDAAGIWHPLAEHWSNSKWTVVPTPDPNGGANLLYAVAAASSTSVVATGQGGTSFPSRALVERWDGHAWSTLPTIDASASLDPLGVATTGSVLTLVGARESDASPFTTLVAAGALANLGLVRSPNVGTSENDLFAATTAADGSTWAAGWYLNAGTGSHLTLTEHGVNGVWSVVPSPNPGTQGDNGLAGITSIPGGSLWAVGIATKASSPATLIEYHP